MKIVKKSVAKPIETRDILCYNTVRKWVSVRLQIYDSTLDSPIVSPRYLRTGYIIQT